MLTGSFALTVLFGSVASAQDVEPNDTCQTAQEGGALVLPAVVSGSIAKPVPMPPFSDVDFYRVSAPPGAMLRITGSLGSRAGAFSEDCGLLAAPDTGVETEVDFRVPASGRFILAVAERFDEFFGGCCSGAPDSGPYTVTIALSPPPIGSITGRLVDAATGGALTGWAILRRCTDGVCSELVALQGTEEVPDGTGVFHFEEDFNLRPILVGDFELEVGADMGDARVRTLRFSVGAGEDLDLGDVELTGPPIVLSNTRPCAAIAAQGGTCQLSVSVRNNTPQRVTGQAFSIVNVLSGGPGFVGTSFEASAQRTGTAAVRAPISIPGRGASRDVTFFFKVPPSLPEGTRICPDLKVGLDPYPLFNVQASSILFCITKEASGFRTMSGEETRESLELMQRMDRAPARQPK